MNKGGPDAGRKELISGGRRSSADDRPPSGGNRRDGRATWRAHRDDRLPRISAPHQYRSVAVMIFVEAKWPAAIPDEILENPPSLSLSHSPSHSLSLSRSRPLPHFSSLSRSRSRLSALRSRLSALGSRLCGRGTGAIVRCDNDVLFASIVAWA